MFNTRLIEGYHSVSQTTRILTETWFETNMFCPRCGNPRVKRFDNNRPVADFYCSCCNSEYELKSKRGDLRTKINDGAYSTMIQRITGNNNPDLFCMRYDKIGCRVLDLVFIPKYFFTPDVIEKRNPLSETARRTGWVGCNILIGQIPEQAKIKIITQGQVGGIDEIVRQVKKCDSISTNDMSARSWLLDVLNCINLIKTHEFILDDIYRYEDALAIKHPNNNNIRAKIRQQLQLLRDKGYIAFLGNGNYKKL